MVSLNPWPYLLGLGVFALACGASYKYGHDRGFIAGETPQKQIIAQMVIEHQETALKESERLRAAEAMHQEETNAITQKADDLLAENNRIKSDVTQRDRLLDAANKALLASRREAAANSGSAGTSQDATEAGFLLAELQRSMATRIDQVNGYADEIRIRGEACERERASLVTGSD